MPLPDAEKIAEILKQCAQDFILPRFRVLQAHEIDSKTGPNDLVTQADLDVEEHLTRVLPGLLPGSAVVGEEGVSRGITSLDILLKPEQDVWVVDPVDGTYNFVHGRPEFGIMLACVIGGETVQGWIYDVPADSMVMAEKGGGAFRDGKRVQVKKQDSLAAMTMHINPRYFPKRLQPHIKSALKSFGKVHSLGSAAHEYTRIACGKADAAIYGRAKPWDHLPGTLIVQEAGGYAAKLDGTPYRARDRGQGLLAATSRENWDKIRGLIDF